MSTVLTAPSNVHPAFASVLAEFARSPRCPAADGAPVPAPLMAFGFPDPTPDDTEAEYAARQTGSNEPPTCRSCGCEDSGNELFGVHVPLCDRCLANAAVLAVGLPLAQSVVEEWDAEEGDDWRVVRAENEARRVALRRGRAA